MRDKQKNNAMLPPLTMSFDKRQPLLADEMTPALDAKK
jgi:hypothetical protein